MDTFPSHSFSTIAGGEAWLNVKTCLRCCYATLVGFLAAVDCVSVKPVSTAVHETVIQAVLVRVRLGNDCARFRT